MEKRTVALHKQISRSCNSNNFLVDRFKTCLDPNQSRQQSQVSNCGGNQLKLHCLLPLVIFIAVAAYVTAAIVACNSKRVGNVHGTEWWNRWQRHGIQAAARSQVVVDWSCGASGMAIFNRRFQSLTFLLFAFFRSFFPNTNTLSHPRIHVFRYLLPKLFSAAALAMVTLVLCASLAPPRLAAARFSLRFRCYFN